MEEINDPVYSFTTNSYMAVEKEIASALLARDYKDPQSIVKNQ